MEIERDHFENLGVDNIMLKWIFNKYNGEAWAGFVWLRTRTADCHL
jgi:hypothetical protein